jgi:hypothetical protein
MRPAEQGRHCVSCQKTVIDFTSYSDTELAEFFKKKKNETVCGRMQSSQLERTIFSFYPVSKLRSKWMALAIGFISAIRTTHAQRIVQRDEAGMVIQQPEEAPKIYSATLRSEGIKGNVIDAKSKEAIPAVAILVVAGNYIVTADLDGNFFIPATALPATGKVVLRIMSVAYQAKEAEVVFLTGREKKPIELIPADVVLDELVVRANLAISGQIIVGGLVQNQKSRKAGFFYRLFHWRKFRREKSKD